MTKEIKNFLDKYDIWNQYIVLACSSGPDSMYLFYEFLKTKYRKNLIVCYFNHKTRIETDNEENFLNGLCLKESIKFETKSCDFEKLKKISNTNNFEELARNERYKFFQEVCNKYSTKIIFTAHHLDDKIETFFFNLLRGSKLTWLINMKEESVISKEKIRIFRPLLDVEKKEILDFLTQNNLKFFVDDTNFDKKITRNKLRLDVMPIFPSINSKYKQNISNFQNYLFYLKDFINSEIEFFLDNQKKLCFDFQKYGLDEKNFNWYFRVVDFNEKKDFFKKEIISYIFFISNNNSSLWLSESNISEVIRFINWKNNKTVKKIKNMNLRKENNVIIF